MSAAEVITFVLLGRMHLCSTVRRVSDVSREACIQEMVSSGLCDNLEGWHGGGSGKGDSGGDISALS